MRYSINLYKVKVPPWYAVLWEAWRNLLLQNYFFSLTVQVLPILFHRNNDFPAKSSSKA